MTATHTISLFNSNEDMTAAGWSMTRVLLWTRQANMDFYYRAAAARVIFIRRWGKSNYPGKILTLLWLTSDGSMKMIWVPMPLW